MTITNDPECLPHRVRRIASVLAAMLTQNGVELSQADLLYSFKFWAEPNGGLWIRRRRDGVEISFHEFIVECCAESLRKDFVRNHSKGESRMTVDPTDVAENAKRSFVSTDPAVEAKTAKDVFVQPNPADIADAAKKEFLQ
jgi:hypothetical protein